MVIFSLKNINITFCFLVNDLERSAKMLNTVQGLKLKGWLLTYIELLRKKLSHEKDLASRDLRSFRFPYDRTADSGLHSPERRGESKFGEKTKIKTNFLKTIFLGSTEEY